MVGPFLRCAFQLEGARSMEAIIERGSLTNVGISSGGESLDDATESDIWALLILPGTMLICDRARNTNIVKVGWNVQGEHLVRCMILNWLPECLRSLETKNVLYQKQCILKTTVNIKNEYEYGGLLAFWCAKLQDGLSWWQRCLPPCTDRHLCSGEQWTWNSRQSWDVVWCLIVY